MNKNELVADVAQRANLDKNVAEDAVMAVLDAITNALVEEDKIQIVGFGSFEVKYRSERVGRNPRTREEITIPASKIPTFKPGKALKDAVAGK